MATNGSTKGPEDASKDDKSKPNAKEDDLDLLEDDDEFEEFETEGGEIEVVNITTYCSEQYFADS